ncbi:PROSTAGLANDIN REDUCTASE [Salix koriyanagi]|uniref:PROSTAGLANDIN REDUCTASE n=1 Tax=Salix koriyanagi TaxID=2511006 RepID=A0A9Q0WVK1_9ROSI|nr:PROSTAGLANDIN REDUCTASE [Salix koriyanagi]
MEMVSKQQKQVVLKDYVRGYPKESDFELRSSDTICGLSNGSRAVLLKNLCLACDPYMRHRMSDQVSHPGTIIKSYSPGSVRPFSNCYCIQIHVVATEIGQEVLVGYGVCKVIQSTHPGFQEGDFVWGLTGWEEYTVIPHPERLNKISYTGVPLSYYTGILGTGGIAAYVGFYNLCSPKAGETVYVSSACGGSLEIKGFVETDFKHIYPEYLEFAIRHLQEGKLVYVEDIAEGLENASSALIGVFHGRNVGKKVVRVASG